VTGDDGEGDGSVGEAEEEAPPAPRDVPQRAPRDDGWNDRERVPEERMNARPEPLPRPAGNRARMRFKVTPEDAAVYIDDKYLGAGEDLAANPRGVVTDPGTHTITVARPGYKTKTVNITVRIGAPVDVVVELEKYRPPRTRRRIEGGPGNRALFVVGQREMAAAKRRPPPARCGG
jgi:hypothetical protein